MAKYLNVAYLTKDQKQALVEVLKAAGFRSTVSEGSNDRTDNLSPRYATLGIYSDLNVFNFLVDSATSYSFCGSPEITLQEFFDEFAPSWANSLQSLGAYYWVDTRDMKYTFLGESEKCGWEGSFGDCLFEFDSKDSSEKAKLSDEACLLEITPARYLSVYTKVYDGLGQEVGKVTSVKAYKDHLLVTALNTTTEGVNLHEKPHSELSESTFKLYGGYIKISTGG